VAHRRASRVRKQKGFATRVRCVQIDPPMNLEVPRALVSFDPSHPKASDLTLALKEKFGNEFVDPGIPGSVVIILRAEAPDADALLILEEVVGQGCPGLIAYPRLYR